MEALTWGAKFETGLGVVDEQHRRLVALSNDFGELAATEAQVPRARLEAVVTELVRYAGTHFAEEESLMVQAGVDERFATAHKAQHAGFLSQVQELGAAGVLESPETVRAMFHFLLQWLSGHILGSDMQLARQVQRIRKGESAEAAYRAEVKQAEGPSMLLLGALDDLMRVVARRNAELVESHKNLEAQVAARTADLKATIETLQGTQARVVDARLLASVGPLAASLAEQLKGPLTAVRARVAALGDHARNLLEVVDVAEALSPTLPPHAAEALADARRRGDVAFVHEDLDPLLRETQQELGEAQSLARDIQDFTRVDPEAVADLDLERCVETLLRSLPAEKLEGVSLMTRFAPMPRVRCQAAQVSQALLDIILNALQAVQDRPDKVGAVTIRGGIAEQGLYVEVSDTGVGMAPEVRARAQEPFFTTRPAGQGLGLGLTTAADCAHAHGGRLELSSEAGEGTVVKLWLPLNLH